MRQCCPFSIFEKSEIDTEKFRKKLSKNAFEIDIGNAEKNFSNGDNMTYIDIL